MKKIIFISSLFFVTCFSQAQQTQNYVTKFNSPPNIINSSIFDNGTIIGIGGSTNSVGIGTGTATPAGKFNVLDGKTATYSPTAIPTPSFELDNFNNSGNDLQYSSLGFKVKGTTGGNTPNGAITLVQPLNANKNGDFAFTLRNVGGSCNEIMRLQSTGFVGIGTTSPYATLDVHGSSGATLKIVDGNQSLGKILTSDANGFASWQTPTTSTTAWQLTGNSGTTAGTNFIGTNDAKDLVIKTNNGERMRITSGGYVGIGTTTIPEKLSVNGNGFFGNYSSGYASIGYDVHTDGAFLECSKDLLINYTTGKNVQIGSDGSLESSSGNLTVFHSTYLGIIDGSVGIGTSTTSSKLHIKGSTNDYTAFALKTDNASSNPLLYVRNDGNVGIGASNPGVLLDVKLPSNVDYYSEAARFSSYDGQGSVFIVPKLCGAGYNYLSTVGDQGIFWNDGLAAQGRNLSAGFVIAPMFAQWGGIRITSNGNVGIGTPLTSNPNGYMLAVAGTIGAKEVYVETTTATWPDYVFGNGYNLLKLKDVESYLKLNNHLPDVPSACEIGEKGIAVGEMNKVLLKKIEELYLYVIQQQKEIEELKKK